MGGLASSPFVGLAYLIGVLFILALRGLSSRARAGRATAMA
jgi:NAD/NADP transhydrogenase beta subunit